MQMASSVKVDRLTKLYDISASLLHDEKAHPHLSSSFRGWILVVHLYCVDMTSGIIQLSLRVANHIGISDFPNHDSGGYRNWRLAPSLTAKVALVSGHPLASPQ